MTEWRDVPGYEGAYRVSEFGTVESIARRVWSCRGFMTGVPARVMQTCTDKDGYERLKLSKGGRYKTFGVHMVVALAFIGDRPDGMQICHSDGNCQNNHYSNLRYDTCAGNQQDRLKHGRHFNAVKTHCRQGHPYNEANTRYKTTRHGVSRDCRVCDRDIHRKRRMVVADVL